MPQAGAGQASAEVRVQVELAGAQVAGARVFCSSEVRPNASGATVTVVCSTGAIASLAAPARFTLAHGGTYQYLLQVSKGEPLVVDSEAGSGALWRLVKLGNQEYLELTLAW